MFSAGREFLTGGHGVLRLQHRSGLSRNFCSLLNWCHAKALTGRRRFAINSAKHELTTILRFFFLLPYCVAEMVCVLKSVPLSRFMPLAPNSSGKCISFQAVHPPQSFLRLFVHTDIVTVISYESLERFWWKLTRNIYYSLQMTWLDSGGRRSKSQQAMVKASTSRLHRGPSSVFKT